MPLHLIKLCVGAELIADLEEWVAERVAERVRRGGAPRSQHVTRMVPARAPELVDGGSLYWVIKGQLAARQRLLEIEPFVGDDGIRRCRLWLGPDVAAIRPRPMRPFQGWRYFADEDAPADLDGGGSRGRQRRLPGRRRITAPADQVDQERKRPRSSSSMPKTSQMTASGSGKANSANSST